MWLDYNSVLVARPLRNAAAHGIVRKDIVQHRFHKLTVVLSSVSTSQYGYFDVDTLFWPSHIHSARHLTYNWVSIALCVITVDSLFSIVVSTYYKCHTSWRTLLFCGIINYFVVSSIKCEGEIVWCISIKYLPNFPRKAGCTPFQT